MTGPLHADAARLRAQLLELAGNLWWSWGIDGSSIFHALDPERFETSGHDPHAVIAGLDDARLVRRVDDQGLAGRLDEAVDGLRPTSPTPGPGATTTPAACTPPRSLTSAPSSDFTNRCRSTRAVSSWRAITSRAPRTAAYRSWESDCCTARATSARR
ncbi:MAG: DUF3417 domain-containing protein [Polyangiales bacterium]